MIRQDKIYQILEGGLGFWALILMKTNQIINKSQQDVMAFNQSLNQLYVYGYYN